tara:strand:+ start:24618 stop:25829 length:1212 start_codon:yes stop_codon:yes gene_type:complete
MRILFLTSYFPPESTPGATRTYAHVSEWAKSRDIKITVITPFPNFPFGKVYKGYKNKLYQKEVINNIEIIRVWTFISPNKGVLKRIISQFSFLIVSFIIGLFQKFDLVIATSPPFFTTWSAFLLSFFKRKPWIFELRDIWPESIKSVGAIKNEKIISFLEKIELALYKHANIIIALTNSFKKNLIKRGIPKEKIEVVENGASNIFYEKLINNQEFKKELNLDNKFVVGYIGTMGMAHGLDFIINSIPKIDDDNIHFLFVGDGAKRDSIVKQSKMLNLRNITFIGLVSETEVVKYMSICDITLVNLIKSETFKNVLPSKIFNSAAMKKPILLGVEGESKELVEGYNAGIYFDPENEKDFVEKLLVLKNNEFVYNECRKGCKKLSKDYNRQVLAKRMINIISAIK